MERSAQQGKVVSDLRVVLMMVDWGPMGGGGWKREVATKRAHVAIVHRESKNKWIECICLYTHKRCHLFSKNQSERWVIHSYLSRELKSYAKRVA